MLESVDLRLPERESAVAIARTLSDTGAFLLTGHGLSEAVIRDVHSAVRDLHALSHHEKRAVAVGSNGLARGWHEGVRAGKGAYESYEIGLEAERGSGGDWTGLLHGPNVWPALPHFRSRTSAYFNAVQVLSARLCELACVGLGLPPEYISLRARQPCCLLRLLSYAAGTGDAGADGIAPHTDFEVLTVVSESEPGVELCDAAGTWQPVGACEPGTLLVLAGDILEIITAGGVESPLHRVRVGARPRRSVAFFYGLDANVTVAPQRLVRPDARELYRETIVGEHLARMQILSYPDLATTHGSDGVTQFTATLGVPAGNPYKLYKLARARHKRSA